MIFDIQDFFIIQIDLDDAINALDEALEMLVAMAILLFVWLNGRMLSHGQNTA